MSDIKEKISNVLSQVKPFDSKEQEHINDALDWIASGVEIFKIKGPNIPPKHVVSFSVLFDAKEKKILMLDHRKSLLMLPNGGHLNIGEMPAEAAKRELFEELGIESNLIYSDSGVPFFVSQIKTVGLTAGHVDVDLWYLFSGDSSKPINDGGDEFKREFAGYRWMSLEEILSTPIEKLDASMHRFVEKLKNAISV